MSFAAEVSFQSPYQSPRRPSEKDSQGETEEEVKVEAIEMAEDVLTLHLLKEGESAAIENFMNIALPFIHSR